MRISILVLPLATLLFTVATLAEPEASPPTISRSASKSNEKLTFPKKVTSLKKRPTKSSTTVGNSVAVKLKKPLSATVFKNLTADDLEFIKELDHQFSVHGDKIKIKVERTNTTETKNPKRTIDGDLGYGYSHNGYEYERPKFMFYPYSQKDISSDSPGYYPKTEHTSVTIEPSYSYELKPETYEEPQIDLPTPDAPQYSAHSSSADESHHLQQQQKQQHYEEPVIVLRIPGPAKYASHLQSLLQQYLEIRAAQYLRILENSELQHQQPEQHVDYQPQHEHSVAQPQEHHSQQYEQPPQHVDYHLPQPHHPQQQYEQPSQHADHADYQQQVAYGHQTPQPISYPAIDDVYHSYRERHQQQQQQHQEAETYATAPAQQSHHQEQQPQYYHQQETAYHAPAAEVVPQYYYMHNPHYAAETPHTDGSGSNAQSYQHVYVIAMSSPHAPAQQLYAPPEQLHQHQQHMEQPIYVQNEHQAAHANEQEQQFSITENSPRETHTKVFFSTHSSGENSHEYTSMHKLPSIRPYERYAPVSTPSYQHQQQQHAEESAPSAAAAVSGGEQHSAVEYQEALVAPATAAPKHEVAITQRPHNYHAHPHKPKGRTRISAKRDAAAVQGDTDKHLEEIHAYVANKLGAKMGAQEVFKTTKIIEG